MRVLVACEMSGVVRDAFIAKGHDAHSCDILPSELPGPHFQCNVLDILDLGWDLLIAHPPCTYLSNSGVQHLYKDNDRLGKLEEAATFFRTLAFCDITKKCIENPVMSRIAKIEIGCFFKKPQIVHPWQFGDSVQKQTCLWLFNLPNLVSTEIVSKGEMLTYYNNSKGKWERSAKWFADARNLNKQDRQRVRSYTSKGIALAMADQWG